jgi:DNA-binding GntR family transcriptional regulator
MRQSLREKIYLAIRDQITSGSLLPGERLIEAKLVTDFKSSRSPIREALGQLESESLITRETSGAITVSKLSIKQIDEIYSIREILESYATGLTAEKATKNDTAHLASLNSAMVKAAKILDLEKWLKNNALFHDYLIKQCGNDNLIGIIETLHRRVFRYRYMIVRIPSAFDNYIQQHEGILRACKDKDPETAKKFMELHIKATKELLIKYLHQFPGL